MLRNLPEKLANTYFCGLTSKIGGIGLEHIAADTLARHFKAFFYLDGITSPEQYGTYKFRKNGEKHLWTGKAISSLHKAVRENDYTAFKEYAKESNEADTPVTLRSLFSFKPPLLLTALAGAPTAEKAVRKKNVPAFWKTAIVQNQKYGKLHPAVLG